MAIERKIAPRGRTTQSSTSQTPSFTPSTHFPPTHSQTPNTNTPWCSFHKITSNNTSDCRVLNSIKTNKTLLTEHIDHQPVEDHEEVPLEKLTAVDPSLILMTT